MKYKIGDKVRYDGGDWWFYATVCAVFDHPVCPCYRLDVERMEKKNCRFSINQFEFELQTDDTVVIDNDNRFFNFIQALPVPAPKPLPVLPETKPVQKKAPKPKQVINPAPVPKPEPETAPLTHIAPHQIKNLCNSAKSIFSYSGLQNAIDYLKSENDFDENLLKHISPLGWEHINFLGEYSFKMKIIPKQNEFRPLNIKQIP